jgi:hypothetical protein
MDLVLEEPAEGDEKVTVDGVELCLEGRAVAVMELFGLEVDVWNVPFFKGFSVRAGSLSACC